MQRALFALIVLFSTQISAADSVGDSLLRLSEATEQQVMMSTELFKATRDLFLEYQNIMQVPESTNLKERMQIMAAQFARDFEAWSLLVARNTYGPIDFRQKAHRGFLGYALAELAQLVPDHSLAVDQEFANDFTAELNRINQRQQGALVNLEKQHYLSNQMPSLTELAVSLLSGMTLFAYLHTHLPDPNGFVSVASAMAAAYVGAKGVYTFLKRGWRQKPENELIVRKMAAAFNSKPENICERLLSR